MPLHTTCYCQFRNDASSSRRMIVAARGSKLCVVALGQSLSFRRRVHRITGESIMKSWFNAVIAVAVLSAPFASFAQSSGALSRAEVRGELVQLERAGYSPVAEDASYPAKLRAAEVRVDDVRIAQARAEGYGSSTGAAGQSGRASKRVDAQGLFLGQ
jgi:hypothetical protein